MRLYHGSNTLFTTPDLDLCRPDKDFGRGFYLTEEESQARKMSHRTTIRYGGAESLMLFDFDWHAAVAGGLKIRRFDAPNKEWAMFVMANRRPQREAVDHNRDNRYDLVVGPVANDDLALLFRQFERNLISDETLVREMRFKRLTIQYSFHTLAALAFLKFVEANDVR